MGDTNDMITQVTLLQEQASAANSANANAYAQSLLQNIQTQKSTALNAAYGDLQDSTNALHALMYYGARDNDLSGAQTIALNSATASANQLVSDQQLASRQNEINQWTASNKLDTLFVYQQLLIILTTTIILVYLMKRGILPTTVFYITIGALALIFVFTIVNRAQYTTKSRDKQFWNKRSFEIDAPIAAPQICSS
jgi:hypothetical protein